MAKKKKKRPVRSPAHQPQRSVGTNLTRSLAYAEELLQHKKWSEAQEVLTELHQQHPQHPQVLEMLANLSLDQKNIARYQYYVEKLLKQQPDDPDLTVALAGAYLTNQRFALALRTFRQFLARWPADERAPEVQRTIDDIDVDMLFRMNMMEAHGPDGLDLAVLHEKVLVLIEQGEMAQARAVATQFITRQPDFPPVLNNISQTYYAEGDIAQAIATARQVLDIDPHNIHALCNMTRYLCIAGRLDEARAYAARLTGLTVTADEQYAKQMEALSYLGDDDGVLEVFAAAERVDITGQGMTSALMYHFAAVATMRQGDEKRAKDLWQQALKEAPWFSLARENLDDLNKPVEERHAPWPFSLSDWLPLPLQKEVQALAKRLANSADTSNASITRQMQRWLKAHPEIINVIPHLLERSDPIGRRTALYMAEQCDQPEVHAALREFALGQSGPDKIRMQAVRSAQQIGSIPSGQLRMWLRGEWSEVIMMDIEITTEPMHNHKSKTAKLAADATRALREHRVEDGMELLHQAIALEPDAPDLQNNLAMAYSLQGDAARAEAMVREIHQQYPDYFSGVVNMARIHLQKGELDEAQALLQSLLERKRLHISEMENLCETQVRLLLAKGESKAAQAWLDLWSQVNPDNPNIAALRGKLSLPAWLRKLLRVRKA
jgi:tetratricopeptide (TPR) repeat protein